jgi:hypothetical protein
MLSQIQAGAMYRNVYREGGLCVAGGGGGGL